MGSNLGAEQHMAMEKRKPTPKPEVRIKPRDYQPRKAELDEGVRIDATQDQLARAVLTQVKVVEDTAE